MRDAVTRGVADTASVAHAGAELSFRIRLLGHFQVFVDGLVVDEACWKRPRAKALVKLLALRPDHRLHRERLMEVLWPASAPSVAANQLNKLMHMARHALEPGLASGSASRFLVRQGDLIVLQAPDGVYVDVDAFESLAAAALSSRNVADYAAALALYSGNLLDEDLYEDWVAPRRDELDLLRQDLLLRLARAHADDGQSAEAIRRWGELCAVDSTNEEGHRQLMRLYAEQGDRRQALRQFERCRDALSQELDAAPEEQTTALRDAIEAGVLSTPSLAPDTVRFAPSGDLAILPFRNATGDDALEYFCEGITETLIGELARLPGMRVMALGTVRRYAAADMDPLLAGQELGVRAVLSGRVNRRGDGLVVAVELIDASDGTLSWSERFDRSSGDIFEVQDEISGRIAQSLRPRLATIDRGRIGRRHTHDSEAYYCYLKGRFHWNRRTAAGLADARACFEEAIEKDPGYALAHAGIADCYNLSSLYGAEPASVVMPLAEASARRAIAIDPSLAEAHTSLGYFQMCFRHAWRDAETSFQTAIASDPSYATARQWYHMFLASRGRFDEADLQIQEALALDPLSLAINTEAGWGRYMARCYGDAENRVRAALALDPRFPLAHLVLALILLKTDREAEARDAAEQAIRNHESGPFTLALGVLACAHGRLEQSDEAAHRIAELESLSTQDYATAYSLVLAFEGLGDHESALSWLERALHARLDRLVFLDVEPLLDDLRDQPAFQDLRRRMDAE